SAGTASASGSSPTSDVYTTDWVEVPFVRAGDAHGSMPAPSAIAPRSGRHAVDRAAAAAHRRDEVIRHLDDLSVRFVTAALFTLGLPDAAGYTFSAPALAHALGI